MRYDHPRISSVELVQEGYGFSFQSVIESRMSFPAHSPMCGRRGVVVASAHLVHSQRSPDVIDAVTELVELRWSEAEWVAVVADSPQDWSLEAVAPGAHRASH